MKVLAKIRPEIRKVQVSFESINKVRTSVADPGCFMPDPGSRSEHLSHRILDPGPKIYPGSQIQGQVNEVNLQMLVHFFQFYKKSSVVKPDPHWIWIQGFELS
jgi:hypothetical protein